MGREIEPEQTADRPRKNLPLDRQPIGIGLRRPVQQLAPLTGPAGQVEESEERRTSRQRGYPPEQLEVLSR